MKGHVKKSYLVTLFLNSLAIIGFLYPVNGYGESPTDDSEHSSSPPVGLVYQMDIPPNYEALIARWKELDDRDPEKIWLTMGFMDRSIPVNWDPMIIYIQSHHWDDRAASMGMDRLLSWRWSGPTPFGFMTVTEALPDKWLFSYTKNLSSADISMSSPERLAILFNEVMAGCRSHKQSSPDWLMDKIKSLASFGGYAAFPYAYYGPEGPYLLDRLVNVANSKSVGIGILLAIRKFRPEYLEAHHDFLQEKIHREKALYTFFKLKIDPDAERSARKREQGHGKGAGGQESNSLGQ